MFHHLNIHSNRSAVQRAQRQRPAVAEVEGPVFLAGEKGLAARLTLNSRQRRDPPRFLRRLCQQLIGLPLLNQPPGPVNRYDIPSFPVLQYSRGRSGWGRVKSANFQQGI